MDVLPTEYKEPTTDYVISWDDAGRSALYPSPKEQAPHPGPVPRKGPRMTGHLSPGGVRVLRGAGSKAVLIKHPLIVMITFTVAETLGTEHPREAVADGSIILSEQINRTIMGLKIHNERAGDTRPFHYAWAAENPLTGAKLEQNGKGEAVAGTDCPHVHMLTSWCFKASHTKATPRDKVARKAADLAAFLEFTAWLEGLWGLGFAHVEFIRDANKAAAYLLKALRYLVKVSGEETPDQWIRGQRYYVSDGIRPIRQSRPVVLEPETVKRLSVLRYQGGTDPLRFDDGRIVFNRWCVNGYGLAPSAFLEAATSHALAYYLDTDFRPDRDALRAVAHADETDAGSLRRLQAETRAREALARQDRTAWPLERLVDPDGVLVFDASDDWITGAPETAPGMCSTWPLTPAVRAKAYAGLEERLALLRAWDARQPPVSVSTGSPDPSQLVAC